MIRSIIIFLFSLQILYSQNISLDSDYSKNWLNHINRKTIDMKGALYEAIPGGNWALIQGSSPFFLIRQYKFLGARSDFQAYYSHQRPISEFYDNAPSAGIVLVEGYSIKGSTITRYSKYVARYNDRVDDWNSKNTVEKDGRLIAKSNASWGTYPVPQPEDINWAEGDYAGELY